ncbi:hypothetical protein HYDPIDRAFT_171577, partial [Hydnomerulius pinastri MD-312]
MPQNIPRTQPARRNFNTNRIPCGSCTRWFKTAAGRTKHHNAAHPTLSFPVPCQQSNQSGASSTEQRAPSESVLHDSGANGEGALDNLHQVEGNAPPEHEDRLGEDPTEGSRVASPPPEVDSEYVNRGNHLYRNYHMKMNARPCSKEGIFLPSDAPPPPAEPTLPTDWMPFNDRIEFKTAEFLYTRNQMSAGDINFLLELWAASLVKHDENPPFADADDLYDTIDSTELGDVKWESFTVQYTGEKP